MKVPLRYQNTEYDCGTTSFVNALAYLFDREEVPVELIKAIYRYTLDVEDESGVIGKGGTSRNHAEYSNKNDSFNITTKILSKEEVNLDEMKNCLNKGGVIVARCFQDVEHYVIITKIDDNFAYIFDPYYLEEEYYYGDDDVAIVLHESFSHNRLVKIERLFDERMLSFSLLKKEDREVILINK